MKLNHKGVLAAVIVQQLLGFIWYHPNVFGRLWALWLNKSIDQLTPQTLPFVAAVFASVSFCYLLSWMFQVAVIEDWQRGFTLGLMVGIGFVAPSIARHYLFMEVDSIVTCIDSTYEILAAGLAGIILAVFRAERDEEQEGAGAF
jgi:mannose/fructose/N-acetylgalactosamine-specific phosphotransferase system component IIC